MSPVSRVHTLTSLLCFLSGSLSISIFLIPNLDMGLLWLICFKRCLYFNACSSSSCPTIKGFSHSLNIWFVLSDLDHVAWLFLLMHYPKIKIAISITCHPSKRIVLSLDWKDTLNLRNSLRVGWGPCPSWCSVDHLASLTLLSCGCSSHHEKDIWPLKFSQEGKIRGWCSSGKVIKGSMENEDVRTMIRDTRNLAWVMTDLCVQGNGVEGGFFPKWESLHYI